MNERRRPPRRGRGPRQGAPVSTDLPGEDNPYREGPTDGVSTTPVESVPRVVDTGPPSGSGEMTAPASVPLLPPAPASPSPTATSEASYGAPMTSPAGAPQHREPREQRGPREPR